LIESVSNKAFKELYKLSEAILGEKLHSVRRDMFSAVYGRSEELQTLLNVFVSIALEEDLQLSSSPSKSVKKENDLLETLSAYVYLLAEGDLKSAKKVFRSASYETQVIIHALASPKVLGMGKEFLFSTVSRLYTISELLGAVLPAYKSSVVDVETTENVFRRAGEVSYPFYLVGSPKIGKKTYKLGYALVGDDYISSNVPVKTIRKYFSEYPGGHLFLYKKNKGTRNYRVLLIAYSDILTMERLIKGRQIALSNLTAPYKLPKRDKVVAYEANVKLIISSEEFSNSLKSSNRFFLVSSKGVLKMKLSRREFYFKIVDYVLNSNYEAVGYKYKDDNGEIKSIRCNVTDRAIEEGIEDGYIKVRRYFFNGEFVKDEYVAVEFGNFKSCKVCGRITNRTAKGLCFEHYRKLYFIAQSHIENEFRIRLATKCNGDVIQMEKYEVVLKPKEMLFRKNIEGFKGQMVLPFNYLELNGV